VVSEGVAHKRPDPLVVRQDRRNHGHGGGIGTRPSTRHDKRHQAADPDLRMPTPRPSSPREFTELRIHDPPGAAKHAATIGQSPDRATPGAMSPTRRSETVFGPLFV